MLLFLKENWNWGKEESLYSLLTYFYNVELSNSIHQVSEQEMEIIPWFNTGKRVLAKPLGVWGRGLKAVLPGEASMACRTDPPWNHILWGCQQNHRIQEHVTVPASRHWRTGKWTGKCSCSEPCPSYPKWGRTMASASLRPSKSHLGTSNSRTEFTSRTLAAKDSGKYSLQLYSLWLTGKNTRGRRERRLNKSVRISSASSSSPRGPLLRAAWVSSRHGSQHLPGQPSTGKGRSSNALYDLASEVTRRFTTEGETRGHVSPGSREHRGRSASLFFQDTWESCVCTGA